jgi:hypothetical protein
MKVMKKWAELQEVQALEVLVNPLIMINLQT